MKSRAAEQTPAGLPDQSPNPTRRRERRLRNLRKAEPSRPSLASLPRERERYYLLPGMGGRNLRRKRRLILGWTVAVGIFFSVVIAMILFFINR